MKATRVFIPQDVEAVGRFVAVQTGLPIADVYSIFLSLAVEGVDPQTLVGMVERNRPQAVPGPAAHDSKQLPF